MVASRGRLAALAFVALGLLRCLAPGAAADPSPRAFRLNLRTRVQPFKSAEAWREVNFEEELRVSETAIVICDMWDDHWCKGAARRVDLLARTMAPVVNNARGHGVLIIHAPSDTMDLYKKYPQRKRMLDLPKVELPSSLELPDPPLPIDDSSGGCDTSPPDKFYPAWTRQNAALPIEETDVISDDGAEIYSLLRQRGVRNLLVMGVHTNMCVLSRPFAIRQMTKWGIRCILVRDLTDSMYDPKDPPNVSHDQGTALVVEYIEKYFCPSALSGDLVRALDKAE